MYSDPFATTPTNPWEDTQHADIGPRVRTEQMRALFERGPAAVLAATVFALATAWQLQNSIARAALLLWLLLKFGTALPRIAQALVFARTPQAGLGWLTRYRVLLALDGLAWGSAGLLLLAPDKALAAGLIVMLCGVATLSVFTLQNDFRSCLGFVIAALAPGVVGLALRMDAFGVYAALAVLTYLFLLLAAARRSARRLVELLTLRFTNADLTLALTDALEKSRAEVMAKDSFVAGMSHELRTPLHGILGLSRMLQRSVAAAEQQQVRLIIRSGEHLLGLINNVLEFSKFKAHGVDVEVDAHDINVARAIEDSVALCMPTAREKQVELGLRMSVSKPLHAALDAYRLRQIVLNLVGNAIKFTDRDGRVRVVVEEEPAGTLLIKVKDTGIGMSAATLATIFDPFSQADISSTRRHGGTGLGLNITKSICDKMGGEIRVRSEPGKGSVFTVCLPLRRAKGGATRQAFADSGFADQGPGASGYQAHTVLLAEDNEVNAIVGEHSLARFGVAVERAENGAAVVERMCTKGPRPDLVLLDCQMPVMDGYEATRLVREYERRHGLQAVPIVALTASAFQADREHCRAVGMNAFLSKPFTEQELRDVLSLFAIVPSDASRPDSEYAALLL